MGSLCHVEMMQVWQNAWEKSQLYWQSLPQDANMWVFRINRPTEYSAIVVNGKYIPSDFAIAPGPGTFSTPYLDTFEPPYSAPLDSAPAQSARD